MEKFMLSKVLVIDDDPAMTELLALLLKTSGFEVVSSNYGADGILRAQNESPDVVILDLMMLEMDGWQVCSAIRKFSSVPILILSALDSPGTIVSALDAGADDFLTKPVSSSVLISRIKTLTRRVNAQEAGTLIPVSTASA
jgi:two-component system response regulator MtrA